MSATLAKRAARGHRDEEVRPFLEAFAALEAEAGGRAEWLGDRRRAAIARFAEVGFPTTREEEWRYTSVAPIARTAFSRPDPGLAAEVTRAAIAPALLPGFSGTELVLVDGRFAPALSRTAGLPAGGYAGDLAGRPDVILSHLGRYATVAESAFTALNSALFEGGALVLLPEGGAAAEPIHVIHVATGRGGPRIVHPRTLVLAGRGAHADLVETYIAVGSDVYFANAVTEIAVGEAAEVTHVKLQREGGAAFHVGRVQVELGRGARFASHLVSLGAALARNEVAVVLAGEGGECTLAGISVAAGRQHVDNRTFLDHAVPRCRSVEQYKHVLGGAATGAFNGKIVVRPDAQKTDARQSNQNLLLSRDAEMDTRPQLEIYADDVKCTHGATVGQLEPDAVFYLRSRGIGEREARALLTYAFASDIVSQIGIEPVRARLDEVLHALLPAAAHGEEAKP
jgi:Fe-S cluster assembly protein SufD